MDDNADTPPTRARVLWRADNSFCYEFECPSAKLAEDHMEQIHGRFWHVKYNLYILIRPRPRPAKRKLK